ncbi:MAG TPA: glycosyl hydrolase [Chthonomonadales bacterium]|nr:glycosyl hydrolase [Chthonomonadales bacterium]
MKSTLLAYIALSLIMQTCVPAGSASHPTSAVGWRALADSCVAGRRFTQAADDYLRAADIYTRTGDSGAAEILRDDAMRYSTDVRLFMECPARYVDLRSLYTRRRLEPVYGAYIGAFIDREDGVGGRFLDENGQIHKDCAAFEAAIGRKHTDYFMYMRYGNRFPTEWTENLRRDGAAAQLVLSPDNLDEVKDNNYLRGLAEAAGRSGIPIFLRFAGEMNGDWVPYHGDPQRYIQAFRLVADVFHSIADNVAMVWCVNDVPQDQIARYYPGADAVDWVGVNFYSVPYNNGSIAQPAQWRNPADNLQYVYKLYAARHPIMIGEYAASHLCKVDMRPVPDFAIDKIGQLYSSLPRLYPRVKAVHWLSMDTLKYAMPERQLNNYSLLADHRVAEQYREMISDPYFLTSVYPNQAPMAYHAICALRNGAVMSGIVKISAWVRSYEERPKVVYYVAGKPASSFTIPGAYEWSLDTRELRNGPIELKVAAFDSRNQLAGCQTVHAIIRN